MTLVLEKKTWKKKKLKTPYRVSKFFFKKKKSHVLYRWKLEMEEMNFLKRGERKTKGRELGMGLVPPHARPRIRWSQLCAGVSLINVCQCPSKSLTSILSCQWSPPPIFSSTIFSPSYPHHILINIFHK